MMLSELRIGNLALADDLVVSFTGGLTMITGETGAGKSLVAGALSLLTGAKADRQLIRQGEDLAWVEAIFDLADAGSLVKDLGGLGIRVGGDGVLVLRRELKAEGRGRVLINGLTSSLALLEQIGPKLLSVQSQDQQRLLSKPHFAVDFLDTCLDLFDHRHKLDRGLDTLKEATAALQNRRREVSFAQQQLEVWQYQHREISDAGLDAVEEVQLKERLSIGRNARSLLDKAGSSQEMLANGQVNVRQLLASAIAGLDPFESDSAALKEIITTLRDAEASVADAAMELDRFLDRLDVDPTHLDKMEGRLALYQELARKYNTDVPGLLNLQSDLEQKIQRQLSATSDLDALQQRYEQSLQDVAQQAEILSNLRRDGAAAVVAEAEPLIRRLGLSDLELSFDFTPLIHDDGNVPFRGQLCRVTRRGCEKVNLFAKTNPGEKAGRIADIASGGEKSRIFLGLTVLDSRQKQGPLLLFDEIDAGIGMDQAAAMADLLKDLGQYGQVVCITHLPTMAAQGDSHLRIQKKTVGGRTTVDVRQLDGPEKVSELVRLLGGHKDSKGSAESRLAYARELLASAASS